MPAKAGIQVLNGPFALSASKGEHNLFVIPAEAGIQPVYLLNRLRRCFHINYAAPAPRAAYFLVATRE
jgi:hypothetical protein